MRLLLPVFLLTLACGSSGDKGGKAPGGSDNSVPEAGKAGPKLTECYEGDAFTCEVEAEIVRLTNSYRGKPMAQAFESSFVARQWSQSQADSSSISHDGFPKARNAALRSEFPEAGWAFYAENVAMVGRSGSDAKALAKAFVDMWYQSEGHKQNMLGNYRFIGVGVSREDDGAAYATQIFH